MSDLSNEMIGDPASCPMTSVRDATMGLSPDDMLVLSMHRRMVTQYAAGESGARELHLYYDDKEISFDEPELFAFGEALATQSHFRAGTALGWGDGYEWTKVKDLLQQLVDGGILLRGEEHVPTASTAHDRARTSLLPHALCTRPRSWTECETITRELTGRAVEPGYLELIIPVFRVAHIAVDADNRQVGEANVFPRALRLDTPTEWLNCIYPGTRHQVGRPMNGTALKAMRGHWHQIMAVVHHIRAAFLRRFPEASEGWTVGHIERLTTLVLAVPTYQLVRTDRPVHNGELHPVLSSLFRVTDGVRMVMHQMLFVPIGEPTLSPDAVMTSERIHAYAERNYSFHSETGVCAGPRNMVQEFLAVLLDGRHAEKYASFAFDPAVAEALNEIDAAFDYGLHGLQAYAATFSLWPIMTRAYERLGAIAEAAVAEGLAGFAPFRDRMRTHVASVKTSTFLANESWRLDRERVYADMYDQCGRGLNSRGDTAGFLGQIAPVRKHEHAPIEAKLNDILMERFECTDSTNAHVISVTNCLMDFFVQEQAILRVAVAVQGRINALLGRTPPTRPFGSADADVHNLLQGSESRRLPYLLDELEETLSIRVDINAHHIALDVTGTDTVLPA